MEAFTINTVKPLPLGMGLYGVYSNQIEIWI